MQMPSKTAANKAKAKTSNNTKQSPKKLDTPSKHDAPTKNDTQDDDDTPNTDPTPAIVSDIPVVATVAPVENDATLTNANDKSVDDETRDTKSNVDDEGDDVDDEELEEEETENGLDSAKTAVETPAQPVTLTSSELLVVLMKQIEDMRTEMARTARAQAEQAEQVTGLQEQLVARDRNPRRGRAYAMRPWMGDASILALPTVSTAPLLVLNGPKDAASIRWKKKRNDLMNKWAELKLYDPAKTWGTCGTFEDKIQMVSHCVSHCVCHFTDMSNVCVCVWCACVCMRHFTDMSNVCVCVWCACVCMRRSASTQAANWGGLMLSSTARWST